MVERICPSLAYAIQRINFASEANHSRHSLSLSFYSATGTYKADLRPMGEPSSTCTALTEMVRSCGYELGG